MQTTPPPTSAPAPSRTIWLPLAWGLLPLLLLSGLYAAVLHFPYSWDDLFILRMTDAMSVPDILTKVGFFRLRAFDRLVFRFSYDLWGTQGAVLAHWTSLALGLLNVALVTRITQTLVPRAQWLSGGLAGFALVLFPLSYRDLGSATSNAHLGVAAATLAAILAAEMFRRTGRRRSLGLSLGMSLLAPWAAESGVTTGLIVAAYLLLREWPAPTRRGGWLSGLSISLSLALTLWVASIARGETALNTPLKLLDKTVFFLQILAYPAAPLMRWLVAQNLPFPLAIASVGLGVLALLGAGLIRSPFRRLFVFGLAYWGGAGVISWYALTFEYLTNAAHVFYSAAPAIALVWAAAVGRGLAWPSPRWRWVTAGAALLFLISGTLHLQRGFRLFQLGVEPLRALARAAEAGGPLLAVNLPGWLAWPDPYFAFGNEGVLVLSDESPAQLFLDFNSRRGAQIQAVEVSDLRAHTPYYVGVHGAPVPVDGLADALPAAAAIYRADYQAEHIVLQRVGRVEAARPAPAAVTARFANGLTLVSADFQRAARTVQITLDWYLGAAPTEHTFFVHVLDCAGNVLAQADGPALGRLYPLRQWRPGDRVHDIRYAPVTPPAPDGCYRLAAGLFDTSSGERLPVTDAGGQPYPNAAVTLTFNAP